MQRYTTVGNLGEVILKVADMQLKSVALSYFDSKEMVVIFLGFLAGGVLGEEHLSYLLEVVEATRR